MNIRPATCRSLKFLLHTKYLQRVIMQVSIQYIWDSTRLSPSKTGFILSLDQQFLQRIF